MMKSVDLTVADVFPNRRDHISRTAIEIERMELARFYFMSSDYYQKNLPDTRSHEEYFKEIEDTSLDPQIKKKYRESIINIVGEIFLKKEALKLNEEEEPFFTEKRYAFVNQFINDFRMKSITRWPRIYIFDEKPLLRLAIAEKYIWDKETSEIDYNAAPTIKEVKYEGHIPNKFTYGSGVELKFIRNLTPEIKRSIVKKLAKLFKQKGDGFSGHHIIPRKKFEVFHNFYKLYLSKMLESCHTSLYTERLRQFGRMVQLSASFVENGVLNIPKSYEKATRDTVCSTKGNIFYGPTLRSDDEHSGYYMDKAAKTMLSEDEYKAVVQLDNQLNEFLKLYGFEGSSLFQSSSGTMNMSIEKAVEKLFANKVGILLYCSLYKNLLMLWKNTFVKIKKNHNVESDAILFDPRLVDQQRAPDGKAQWVYRHRKIAEKSLPDWLSTLLKDVAQELQVVLDIDLNLSPVESHPNNDQQIQSTKSVLRLQPLRSIPKFIASSTIIYPPAQYVASAHTIYNFTSYSD